MYITDSLKIIAENSAQHGGKILSKRYAEFVAEKPRETRSADEIIAGIKSKLKGGEPT